MSSNLQYLLSALEFSLLGVVIFFVCFWIVDRLTPYSLTKELLEKQNVALAIVVGSMALGISIIISAAIRG